LLDFYRICRCDIALFWRINRKVYGIWAVLLILIVGGLNTGSDHHVWSGVLALFGGFDPNAKKIAFLWLVPQLLAAILSANYWSFKLSPIPVFHLVRTGKRSSWWLAAVVSMIFHTAIFYMGSFAVLVGTSLFVHNFSSAVSFGTQIVDAGYLCFHLFSMFATTTMMIVLFQSWVSLLAGVIPAYMATVMLYAAAFYVPSRWMPTAHSNPRAYDAFAGSELTFAFSYTYNAVIIFLWIGIGIITVSRIDFLEKTGRK